MLTNWNLASGAIWATMESIVIASTAIYLFQRVFKKIDKRLDKIEYQLHNNGGESMKDAIDRIEADVIELRINQAVIKARLETQ